MTFRTIVSALNMITQQTKTEEPTIALQQQDGSAIILRTSKDTSTTDRSALRMYHVDGLRTIALAGVLLFHFGAPVSGGFLGVDVFFVISGFLMSRAMLKGAENDSFTMSRFLRTRILRLCPALLTVIFITLIAAMHILPDFLIPRLLKSSAGASVFMSNMVFMSEGGYHDLDSTSKPLLHTWSLAVEGQFYLMWSLLPFLRSKRSVAYAIAIVTLSSFFVALNFAGTHGNMFFFLVFGRLYEFGLGCVSEYIYDAVSGPWADLLNVLSCCVIFHNFLVFNSVRTTLGLATVPLIASCVALIATPSGIVNRYILSSSPFCYLGKLSYAVYLVHWPAIVLCRFVLGVTKLRKAMLTALALTMLLSPILFYVVEERFRSKKSSESTATINAGMLYIVVVFVLIFAGILGRTSLKIGLLGSADRRRDSFALSGGDASVNPNATMADLVKSTGAYAKISEGVITALNDKDSILSGPLQGLEYDLLLGDSYAKHMGGMLEQASPHPASRPLAIFEAPGCLPTDPDKTLYCCHKEQSYWQACFKSRNESWNMMIARRPRNIIVSGRWQMYADSGYKALMQTLPKLKAHANRVIVVGIVPLAIYDPTTCLLTQLKRDNQKAALAKACPKTMEMASDDREHKQRLEVIARAANASYLDPTRVLCTPPGSSAGEGNVTCADCRKCKIWDERGGSIYMDNTGHLTRYGSSLLLPEYIKILEAS